MTPRRCPDVESRNWQCARDEGHDGPHVPYVPMTADQWHARQFEIEEHDRLMREALAHEVGRANRLERELREAKTALAGLVQTCAAAVEHGARAAHEARSLRAEAEQSDAMAATLRRMLADAAAGRAPCPGCGL